MHTNKSEIVKVSVIRYRDNISHKLLDIYPKYYLQDILLLILISIKTIKSRCLNCLFSHSQNMISHIKGNTIYKNIKRILNLYRLIRNDISEYNYQTLNRYPFSSIWNCNKRILNGKIRILKTQNICIRLKLPPGKFSNKAFKKIQTMNCIIINIRMATSLNNEIITF